MRLQQLTQALRDGNLEDRSVVITFDDGYADNLHNAKPLLEHYDAPATVFLATGYIGHEREFWWEELDRLLLQPGKLPEALCLGINGRIYRWELGEAAHYSEDASRQHQGWRAWEDTPPSSRHRLYRALWDLLHPLTEAERQRVLKELRGWTSGGAADTPSHRCLSLEETIALAQSELVEVGAHTVTHSTLAALPSAAQRVEIHRSKAWLQEILGRPVASFAYPYGRHCDYTAETVDIVRKAGFACACSNFAGVVARSTDRFQLPRVRVQDWDGEEFARHLSEWLHGESLQSGVALPPEATVIVVGEGDNEPLELDGRPVWHFPQVGGGPEKLFAEGNEGSQEAPWIAEGKEYEFRLYAGTERKKLLDSVEVTRSEEALPPAVSEQEAQSTSGEAFVTASPNPVPAGEGTLGATTISWSTGEEGTWGQVYVAEDGGYYPSNSAETIAQLEELREKGAELTHENVLPAGQVRFGSLRRVMPISREFGYDRGQPIDRYYIENFLARHAEDIRGRVLEIGDDTYTRKYGGSRVEISDVLHVTDDNSRATIVADLARADHVMSDAFDCIIFTQTLQLIYDTRSAVQTLYRILKPGGVLLATFPGVSPISRDQWGETWYWAFTSLSAQRLFEEVFPAANATVETQGNVLAAISFLHGLAVHELCKEELDYHDRSYEVLITLRAVKPEAHDETAQA
jgi:peptidoglycan/xylan/chitin deacetylase (PgdA/CDA1 family)/SAM-dependent methyltransferase